MNRLILAAAAVLVVAVGVYFASGDNRVEPDVGAGGPMVNVILPDTLSADAQIGKTGFEAKCASCHGLNAAGRDGVAPPLVHIIYEPNHHGDEAFQRAAALGVPSHHWSFGNMAPVEGLTRADVAMIVAYVRELQRANGIE
ncbi:c-type cytochrome [Flavimaricola marinus]|uniref:Cytochrome c-554(547) n=1 Tax=Flavimaricola marinus TaxID=1819565 RepID=A0A238LB18_9RHOB|nr:cytochrome c [Flavimaricola marinus]SMY06166.1 Cytochrome c-554(547) [Flavimaricola marinus]